MQDCRSWEDLCDYAEASGPADLRVLVGENWYCMYILSSGEIVDLAANGKVALKDLLNLWKQIKRDLRGREISLDARMETSWKFIQFLVKRGEIILTSTERWKWEGEWFYAIRAVVNPEG